MSWQSRAGALAVRTAEVDDVGPIVALLHQLGYPRGHDEVHRFFDCSHGCIVLLAELDGVPVGLLVLAVRPQLHMGGWIGAIDAMVVDHEHRSQGVGAGLLAAAEQHAASQDVLLLEVHSNDRRHGAHRFYQRHGFVDTSRYFVKPLR